MRKIRRIYETTQEINFISPQKEFSLYWKSFQASELGSIYQAIPWIELAKSFKNQREQKGSRSDIQSSGDACPDVFKVLCWMFGPKADQPSKWEY